MPPTAPVDPRARLSGIVDGARRALLRGATDLDRERAALEAAVEELHALTRDRQRVAAAAAEARATLDRLAALARARRRLEEPCPLGADAAIAASAPAAPPPGVLAASRPAAPATPQARAPIAPPPVAAAPPPAASTAPRPGSVKAALLAPRVTISGNLVVERTVMPGPGGGSGPVAEVTLRWKLPPAARQVVVHVEERPDPRGDYRLLGQEALAAVGEWTLALDAVPKRVLVRVEGRDGRVLARARIAGLTAANAASKWQRQATAA